MKSKNSKTVSLGLMERLIITGILPKETNYQDLVLKGDILEKIQISQVEMSKYEMKFHENGSVTCNKQGGTSKTNYEFTKLESSFIATSLKKLEQENKLTLELKNIYETFCK